MKNFISKSLAFLSALALVASIITTTYSTAFAYDESDEVSIISPLWEVDEECDNTTRN